MAIQNIQSVVLSKPVISIGVKWINKPNAINIYCGRGSALGNPYAMKDMSLEERNDVCDKYHILLKEQANVKDSPMRNEMIRILKLYKAGNNINLQCYCSPKRCHCESIKELIEGVVNRESEPSKQYWYGDKIKSLKPNQIFVFGSNPEGRHGKGAAKDALAFGAKYGNGRGIQGNSYALVTKNLKPMYLEESTGLTYVEYGGIPYEWLLNNIRELYDYARSNPNKQFLIPYTMFSNNLNGYSNQNMYDAFHSFDIPSNIVFHESYK